MRKGVEGSAGACRRDKSQSGNDFRIVKADPDLVEEGIQWTDQNDRKADCHEQNIGRQTQQDIALAELQPLMRDSGFQPLIGWQVSQQVKRSNSDKSWSDGAQAPKPLVVERVKRGAHREADGENGREGMTHALPTRPKKSDDHACRNESEGEEHGCKGSDGQPRNIRNSKQRLESRCHRAEGNRPGMPQNGHDDRKNRVKTHPHQDGRANRYRHAKPAHAL